jgi:hypothetical protein
MDGGGRPQTVATLWDLPGWDSRRATEAWAILDPRTGLPAVHLHYAIFARWRVRRCVCIGSEMRGLTQVQVARGFFLAVAALKELAADVRAILGLDHQIGMPRIGRSISGIGGQCSRRKNPGPLCTCVSPRISEPMQKRIDATPPSAQRWA